MKRREFIALGAMAAAGMGLTPAFAARPDEIRAVLLHLGFNMWCDWFPAGTDLSKHPKAVPDKVLRNRDDLWRKATDHAAAKGMNMIVIDLGEGVVYPSHPELAIEGSWSVEKLRAELARLRGLGLEPVPKLNFATSHNGWLKEYRRMVSSSVYHKVCEDLIRDVVEIFDRPRFFHLGCDEETAGFQEWSGETPYICVRKGEVWWYDFLHLVRTVESHGVRAWAWSDYGWHHPEFMTRCPKSVLLSNWYYDEYLGGFELSSYAAKEHRERLKNFYDLEKAGFDQVPAGTNWVSDFRRSKNAGADDVIGKLVRLCRRDIPAPRLKGFMMASWESCDNEANLKKNLKAIDLFADALQG
jgi:hypothetical protein